MKEIFEKYESNVRSYCRDFDTIFTKAKMSFLIDDKGKSYIDFFAGAGALNYGHNNDVIMKSMIDYINKDGILHALDMYTDEKANFIKKFQDSILIPKNLDYKIMFCGSTGTNANEAALKVARKEKERSNVFAFSGSFHGMTLGSLSLTSSQKARAASGTYLSNVTFMPFPTGYNETFDTIQYMENILTDDHSGIEKPAAIFLETIQSEGGVYVAPVEWLRRLRRLCNEHDILLVCDDIQVGVGRSGKFFSFERAGIVPDMVSLSKSISGCGLPMSILLLKPEIDCLKAGEHNGTFRGNQLAFVAASAALEYAKNEKIYEAVEKKGEIIQNYIENAILPIHNKIKYRGTGMIYGIDLNDIGIEDIGKKVIKDCFTRGLIIENTGRNNAVLKILPALTIDNDTLMKGLSIIRDTIKSVLDHNIT